MLPFQLNERVLDRDTSGFRELRQVDESRHVAIAETTYEGVVVVGVARLWGGWSGVESNMALVVKIDDEGAVSLEANVIGTFTYRELPKMFNHVAGDVGLAMKGNGDGSVGALT
jgi:hypothetical protein